MMKKIIATIASLAMLAGTCAMPVAAEETTTYALGDVNMDGKIDSMDARAAQTEYLYVVLIYKPSTLTDEQLLLADIDGDGVVGLTDALNILWYYAYTLTTDEPIPSEEFYKLSGSDKGDMMPPYVVTPDSVFPFPEQEDDLS